MKYGVREICDVVLKAKSTMKIGSKVFYKNEPVLYFDSLKTSSMEGASTTVYAQGGRGNTRLIAWEGERTVTFTMEDALISTESLAVLAGANVIDASDEEEGIIQHVTETAKVVVEQGTVAIILTHKPYEFNVNGEDSIYVMKTDGEGNIVSEPYIYVVSENGADNANIVILKTEGYTADSNAPKEGDIVFVDYYTQRKTGAQLIEITPDSFGGNFYLEASTLFRDTNGVDMPAEFIIPNCKIQSNFTFTMASSGDPSTFTFTMDAFPGYTRYDGTKKVLSAIQIITEDLASDDKYGLVRKSTDADPVTAGG